MCAMRHMASAGALGEGTAAASVRSMPADLVCWPSPCSESGPRRRAQDWIKDHKARGIQPVFANPSRQVVRLMRAAGLHDLIGEDFITVRMNDAVLLCQARGSL